MLWTSVPWLETEITKGNHMLSHIFQVSVSLRVTWIS